MEQTNLGKKTPQLEALYHYYDIPSGPFLLWKTLPALSVPGPGGATGMEFLFSVREPGGFSPPPPDSSKSFGGGAATELVSSVPSLFTHCFLSSSHTI